MKSSTPTRPVYRHAELDRVLNPRHVCIVGASPKTGSFGDRVLTNLAGFGGNIYLVNSKYDLIGDRRCYPSMASLPENPDCVAVVAPRDAVEDIVREAAQLRVGGVILYASGYAETQLPERIDLQCRLESIGLDSGLKILGPNCLGIANYVRRARISFSDYPAPRDLPGKSIGIASQSGALSQSLAQAIECGVSISHAFSAGNQADVDVADLVAYLADEPSCHAIACVFEGMAHPQRLLEAAQIAWRRGKVLLIHKTATGALGAEAAISHTGSLAGSDSAYRAAFERGGAVVVEEFEGLMEAAQFFAKAPPPKARGIAVLAASGGAAIMAADKAEAHGISLPQPGSEVRRILEANIPDFGSARNPCDVTGQVVNNPLSMPACSDALLSDAAYGALVVPQTLAFEMYKSRLESLGTQAEHYGKITCSVLISNWLQGPGTLEAESNTHVALFRSMDRCFRTLAAWHHRADLTQRGERDVKRVSDFGAARQAARLIADAPNDRLTERESKAVLELYGIPSVRELAADSLDRLLCAATELGFPLALKVESPDISHKSEAGGVALNLRTPDELRAAYERVLANARRFSPEAKISGVLLQPMVPAGVEVVAGARIDPLFGPLVVAGFGGVLVELLRDSSVELAPINAGEAMRMLLRLKGSALFGGFRGAPAVDLARLADILVRVSEFAADQRSLIAELDINPIICSGSTMMAVDALIVRVSAPNKNNS
ncbi:MAG TPA: acetate--CoA ligase family protein [Steroidobacteraceae bacterium]|nr:acetate--CoA ligase family protein [Steroidobacteraceae bacterium]